MAGLAPCGTIAAYSRHRRRGEEIDDACRTAWNAYCADKLRKSGIVRARQRAFRDLGRRYPEAFRALRDEELAREVAPDNAARRRARQRARQRAFTRLTRRYPEAWADLFAKAKEGRS